MEENPIIKILKETIDSKKVDFVSGKICKVGTNDCELSDRCSSVYGIAIEIKSKEKAKNIFEKIKGENKKIKFEKWKPIKDNYYPLYWGKDINVGARLFAHTRIYEKTGTLQLNNKKYSILEKENIIYGAVLCSNPEYFENLLHEKYPDILVTMKKEEKDN